jgi:hypothetical protein
MFAQVQSIKADISTPSINGGKRRLLLLVSCLAYSSNLKMEAT